VNIFTAKSIGSKSSSRTCAGEDRLLSNPEVIRTKPVQKLQQDHVILYKL